MSGHAVLVARQPIYDASVAVAGYEVLYRATADGPANVVDGDSATANVLVHALLDIGLDPLVGKHRAWVNCTRNVLVDKLYEFLPAERVVLEVLEDVDADAESIGAVKLAKQRGYRIAVDDFVLGGRTAPFVEYADVVKVDLPRLRGKALEQHVRELSRPGLSLLAEKVETHDEFERCRRAGYSLFQGFFIARPQLMRGKRSPGDRLLMLRLLARIQDPDVELEEIEEMVRTNVGLSYRLLRYVNSALFTTAQKIESIRHAMAMLGLERVRMCVIMLVLTGLDDKPHELVMTALVRARYCQLLATAQMRHRGHAYFTVGLLSVLDAFMDRPMDELVAQLSITPELEAALLRREGPMGELLDAAIACERADWQRLAATGFDPQTLQNSYLQAIRWAGETDAALSGVAHRA